MKRGDWWIIGAAAVLTLALWLWPRPAENAATVTVITPTEELTLPLSRDTRLTLTGRGNISVTVEIAGGAVRFLESGCPDRLCVGSGWLSSPGTGAACVPAGILLRLEAAGEVDAVAG